MEPVKCPPATAETPEGTAVLVAEDRGRGITLTRTRSAPWEIGPGRLVVMLEGKSGGFLLERVCVVPPALAIGAKADDETLRDVYRILAERAGERGESEGAVEVLKRVIRERETFAAWQVQLSRALALAQSMIRSGERESDISRAVFQAAFDGVPEPELMTPPASGVGAGG